MSTHTLEIAESICDRVAIIHKGSILTQGTVAELQARAGDSQARAGDSHDRLEDLFLYLTGAGGVS